MCLTLVPLQSVSTCVSEHHTPVWVFGVRIWGLFGFSVHRVWMLLEYLCIDTHTGLPRVSVSLLWERITFSELNLPGATKANCVCVNSLIVTKNRTIPNTPFTFGEECMHKKDVLQYEETPAQRSPPLLAPGIGFVENGFSTDQSGDGLGMIQAHYIYCALYFYYYYISSTSDHQALDLRGWGPCSGSICLSCSSVCLFSGSEHI